MPAIHGDYLDNPRLRQLFNLVVSGHVKGLPPSVADVTRALGRTASTVHNQVRLLNEEAGLIAAVGEKNRTRALVLTEKGIERADLAPRPAHSWPAVSLPEDFTFKGLKGHPAPCGDPVFADGLLESVTIRKMFKGYREGDQVIFAVGDSMLCDDESLCIKEDDWVWVRETKWPHEGDRVYVEYMTAYGEHESTIKCFYYDDLTDMVVLRPLNPDYPEIIRDPKDVAHYATVLGVSRFIGIGK